MLIQMIKTFILIFIFLFKFSNLSAEIVKSIKVNGNERISSETIIIFSKVNINEEINLRELNNIIKDLYSTDFFENVSVKFEDNILIINVKENSLVQNISIEGVKNKKLKENLIEKLSVNEKRSFVKENVRADKEKLLNYLKLSGYYFSTVNLDVIEIKIILLI